MTDYRRDAMADEQEAVKIEETQVESMREAAEEVRHGRHRFKRTKTGCQQCRQRRVKCDELRPSCSACRRKNWCCLYLAEKKSLVFVLGTPQGISPPRPQQQPLEFKSLSWTHEQGLHVLPHAEPPAAASNSPPRHAPVPPSPCLSHVRDAQLLPPWLQVTFEPPSKPANLPGIAAIFNDDRTDPWQDHIWNNNRDRLHLPPVDPQKEALYARDYELPEPVKRARIPRPAWSLEPVQKRPKCGVLHSTKSSCLGCHKISRERERPYPAKRIRRASHRRDEIYDHPEQPKPKLQYRLRHSRYSWSSELAMSGRQLGGVQVQPTPLPSVTRTAPNHPPPSEPMALTAASANGTALKAQNPNPMNTPPASPPEHSFRYIQGLPSGWLPAPGQAGLAGGVGSAAPPNNAMAAGSALVTHNPAPGCVALTPPTEEHALPIRAPPRLSAYIPYDPSNPSGRSLLDKLGWSPLLSEKRKRKGDEVDILDTWVMRS